MERPAILIHHGPAPARERPKPRTLDQEIEMATRGIDLALAITPHDDVRAVLRAYRAAVVDMLTIAHRVRQENPMNRTPIPHTLRNIANIFVNLNCEHNDIAAALTDADIPTHHDGNELALIARVRMLVTRRASERRDFSDVCAILESANVLPVGSASDRARALLTDRDRLRAELAAVRALDVVAAPGVAVEWHGCRLHVNGAYFGQYYEAREGGWWVLVNGSGPGPLPNEATARAVLLALVGQPCGAVRFGLREGWTRENLDTAIRGGLGVHVGHLMDDYGNECPSDHVVNSPDAVRAWVAHGQRVLTIEAVTE